MADNGDTIQLVDFLNISMHRATRKLTLMFVRDVLRPEGLTIQEWRSLLYLRKFGNRHLRDLARLAGLDPSHVSKAVADLQRKGLVQASDDKTDGRRKQLAVTENGLAAIDRIWPQAIGLSDRIEADIGKAKFQALKAGLVAILEIEDLSSEGLNRVHATE